MNAGTEALQERHLAAPQNIPVKVCWVLCNDRKGKKNAIQTQFEYCGDYFKVQSVLQSKKMQTFSLYFHVANSADEP